MALLIPPMSAIPHLQHHMNASHGRSVPSNSSHSSIKTATQPDNKRPKLSLQTASLGSTYGSLTRGIAPSITQAIYTPTTANTLSNTWDLTIRPSPISRTESPKPLQQTKPQAIHQPYTYSLPFGIKPILKNSPLPPRAASVSASPRDSRRKVFFPQPKQVSFRPNLEESIETKQYVAKHSDLTSSEEEVSDEEQQKESTTPENGDSTTSSYHTSPPPNRKRKIRRENSITLDIKTEPSLPTSTSTPSSDATITKPPPTHKRRKWHSTTCFGEPFEKEGEALRKDAAKSSDLEHPALSGAHASPKEPPNNEQFVEEDGEVDGAESCRTSASNPGHERTPVREDLVTSKSSPKKHGSYRGDQASELNR